MKECSIGDCPKPSKGRGWCAMHYDRWRRHGDPLKTVRFEGATLEESLNHYFKCDGDCLVWVGRKNKKGYGLTRREDRTFTTHKLMWERVNGPVPQGMLLDHICHNHACGEVKHLRVVTNKQNGENRKGADSTSVTGIRGVHIHAGGRFVAQVQHNGKRIYLGLHDTAEEAGEVAKAKRLELFTHNDKDRAA